MGNRAVVSVEGYDVGVYLHWNGGIESVSAFLRAAKGLGVRDPIGDPSYFTARFAQIAANFFGGTTSIGIAPLTGDGRLDTDNGDNGHYIVGADFKILRREHAGEDAPLATPASLKMAEEAVYYAAMLYNRPIFARE
jgi:hypothetical protein